jgi:hypothetical protein
MAEKGGNIEWKKNNFYFVGIFLMTVLNVITIFVIFTLYHILFIWNDFDIINSLFIIPLFLFLTLYYVCYSISKSGIVNERIVQNKIDKNIFTSIVSFFNENNIIYTKHQSKRNFGICTLYELENSKNFLRIEEGYDGISWIFTIGRIKKENLDFVNKLKDFINEHVESKINKTKSSLNYDGEIRVKLKENKIITNDSIDYFYQIPLSCPPNKLKNTRNIGLFLTILWTSLLVILISLIKEYFSIIYLIAIYLFGLILFLLVLTNGNLSKHLILTNDGFYQVSHIFPFSKCNSLYKGDKIIKWNVIEEYFDLISMVIVIEKDDLKRKFHYLSFRNKDEHISKKILFEEFEKRSIKKGITTEGTQ